jgi:hypothetical protein
VGKLLLYLSALGVPTSRILKNRVAAIENVFWHRCPGSNKRFFTSMSFSFALDFAIVFLFRFLLLLFFFEKTKKLVVEVF